MNLRTLTILTFAAGLFFQSCTASAAAPVEQTRDRSYDTIDTRDLEKPLKVFFGDTEPPPDSVAKGSLAQQELLLLQLTNEQLLKNGSFLITGCQPHNCGAKGAVVMDRNGNIISAAMANMSQFRDEKGQKERSTYAVYIFTKQLDFKPDEVQPLIDWLKKEESDDKYFHNDRVIFIPLEKQRK